jgi:OOP family OmpA-OmpF porin
MDFSASRGEYDQGGIELDGLYFFSREQRWNPYGLLGIGTMDTETPGKSSANLLASAGGGLMHQINRRGSTVRVDARYRYDGDDTSLTSHSSFADWVFNVGFTIPFGGKSTAAAEPVGDSDGDGVNDNDDRCADTPAGTPVDGTGCMADADHDGVTDSKDRCPKTPAARKVNQHGCENDSDRDGVVDDLDRCPGTPAGSKVNAIGCESDSDADGIVDSKDQCPGSRPGDKVDDKGCLSMKEQSIPPGLTFSVTGEAFTLRGVTFEYDSALLTTASATVLTGVAATLRDRPELRVEISGHTDDRGTEPYNIELSRQRAEAVKAFLVKNGVTEANVAAEGYGSARSIASNDSKDGRSQNRRVELRVLTR